MNRKVLFLTTTRADFGKLKPLMHGLEKKGGFEVYIFVSGMHIFPKYGNTGNEVTDQGFKNVYYFINQRPGDSLDTILANTVGGLSNYMDLIKPDMIVVHGDRTEALAGAISGALNNFLVAHIEGGEVSGTIDESIRHSITKLAHLHFVANEEAKKRLLQLGENEKNIYTIGSPDIDVMYSDDLPTLKEAKGWYDVPFKEQYALLIYHPVTTSLHTLFSNFEEVMSAVYASKKNYILIYPNNDPGANIIIEKMESYRDNTNFKIFPSLRFEYFLTFLKNCEFIIGNSSAAIREAPIYSIPAINIGSRQQNRFLYDTITNCANSKEDILKAIEAVKDIKRVSSAYFGDGKSTQRFVDLLVDKAIWDTGVQKNFIDR